MMMIVNGSSMTFITSPL